MEVGVGVCGGFVAFLVVLLVRGIDKKPPSKGWVVCPFFKEKIRTEIEESFNDAARRAKVRS
jgi:hypothetical protein